MIDDIKADLDAHNIQQAIEQRNTPRLFDWLVTNFSYQGVSDAVARSYLDKHGNASWSAIQGALQQNVPCPRLRSYRSFHGCRYDKTSSTCSEPEHIELCSLPKHKLRNGRLNQTAYSFFLFVRDIANNDLVGWIDKQLASSTSFPQGFDRDPLIAPLRHVYGISDKILAMTLSSVLLGASSDRPRWFQAGVDMIAIDTLVHNFMHRTGILAESGRPHTYGVECYREGGCAELVRCVAGNINAQQFNSSFPMIFPRFIQHAIWRFCSAGGLNICNGNRIDDRAECDFRYCHLFSLCSHLRLKHASKQPLRPLDDANTRAKLQK
ncbi:hypothetical protein [Bradyrhizobium symbiodeficiens]|uniref:hypothetical protein n=1 Tax=Bradyrhizobium symbiodeficiens TaxID=1404367 RepID=UPI0015F2AEBD|nr:hypothetical protein [Bradyrhizobium symbiodeficiens]